MENKRLKSGIATEQDQHTEPQQDGPFGNISRRKMLASLGLAGVGFVASRGMVQAIDSANPVTSVTYGTYGGNPPISFFVRTLPQLEDAISSGAKAEIIIVQEINISSNMIIPGNITLMFQKEGMLNIEADVVVTIHGTIHADARQLFKGAGNVDGLTSVQVDWFCEDGDAIVDQADGIRKAFYGKPRHVCFSKREYKYAQQITVSGFDRMVVRGNGAKLVDTGKWLEAINGVWGSRYFKNFCGFLFENFIELRFDDFNLSSTEEYKGAWSNGILANPTEQRPHLGIDGRSDQGNVTERRGKVTLSNILINGQGGSYINMTAQSTLKQAMSPSFIRITHCDQVEISDMEIGGTSGGAEMICIGECNYVHVHDFIYVRTSDVFPVSLGKFIRCDRQLLEKLYIDCPDHTPDCFDLSGKDEIVIRDSYVNWPGGDRFELTSEWKQYNMDIGHVYISNLVGACKDFMTVQTAAEAYQNTIESINVRDMVIDARFMSSGYYSKRTVFDNCTIQFHAAASGFYTYNDTVFNHCVFYPSNDLSVRIWPRGAGAKLKLNHCTVHQMQLWTGTAAESADVDIEFNHCEIRYEDYVGNPFNSAVYYGVNLAKAVKRLAFHDCLITGPMRSRSFFIQNRSNAPDLIRELVFKNCKIDLTSTTVSNDTLTHGNVSLYTIDNNMQTAKNRMLLEGNQFGEHSYILRCSFSSVAITGVEGMSITLNSNTYDKKGTHTFDLVNPNNGYWNTFDVIFMNNVFEGTADAVQLDVLESKARSYTFVNNTMLGYS